MEEYFVSDNLLQELKQFIAVERWYVHWVNKKLVYTEGVHHLAKKTKSYWLIDEIGCMIFPRLVKEFDDCFYSIKFYVLPNCSAFFSIGDGYGNIHFLHKIKWTDFPVIEKPIQFYLCKLGGRYCLILPSEY